MLTRVFAVLTIILVCSDDLKVFEVHGAVSDKDITFTSREQAALDQFRPRVLPRLRKDYMRTDFYLIRWLRARNLNVGQAETMLLQHLNWRQQNRLDTIQKENWSDMESNFPYQADTHDRKGQPVGTVDIYEWDIRSVVLSGQSQRFMRYLYRLLEDINDQIYEAQEDGNLNVTRFIILGNADGFNLVQHACSLCLPYWIQFVRTFEAQYPGFLEQLIVVEAPSTVNVVLDLVRPILSADTRNALHIFGHTRDKWMAYLDTLISRDQRRPLYGGTMSN